MSLSVLNIIKPKFKLVQKSMGILYKDYCSTHGVLDSPSSQTAFVDEVLIKKIRPFLPNEIIKITTYKNSENNILERIFEKFGLENTKYGRVYNYFSPQKSNGKEITGHEISHYIWTGIEDNFIKTATTKVFKAISKNQSSKTTTVTITNVEKSLWDQMKEIHSLTEYPKVIETMNNNGKSIIEKKGNKRFYKLFIKKDRYANPIILKTKKSDDVVLPQKDEFFAMRLYDSEDIREPITRKVITDKRLNSLDVNIFPMSNIMNDQDHNILAFFSFFKKKAFIAFSEQKMDKRTVINSAFHEVEHLFHNTLIGRLGILKNKFYQRCLKLFGPLKNKQKEKLAIKLMKAGEKYPSLVNSLKTEELKKEKVYKIIEDLPKRAGEKGEKKYYKQAKELLEQFPNVIVEEM